MLIFLLLQCSHFFATAFAVLLLFWYLSCCCFFSDALWKLDFPLTFFGQSLKLSAKNYGSEGLVNPRTRVSRARRNVNTRLIVPYQKNGCLSLVMSLLRPVSWHCGRAIATDLLLYNFVWNCWPGWWNFNLYISTCPERIAGQPNLALCTGLAHRLLDFVQLFISSST